MKILKKKLPDKKIKLSKNEDLEFLITNDKYENNSIVNLKNLFPSQKRKI